MKQPKYRIYPSLLDKFQKYLDSGMEADSFFNTDRETGEQKLTEDEIADRHEQELIDMINRVPKEPIEAADKGTCFNEIIDCLIERRKCSREDMTIETVDENEFSFILAQMNGFSFKFDINLCKEVSEYFKGAVCQYLCKGTIETSHGVVELYGYADEIVRDKVYDIKTTSNYDFGKFERCWQKELYPYCLVESGDCVNISEFEYTVIKLKGGTSRTPLISGDIYKEVYTYNHAKTTQNLKLMLERFIAWLEQHRNKITDKKIFNEL